MDGFFEGLLLFQAGVEMITLCVWINKVAICGFLYWMAMLGVWWKAKGYYVVGVS